ncbi:hypothetical protein NTCA1_35300 [Novosphingobium sp. TCA1]|nr:hypothetical protein NTCA1_35300 [Novosphingobium sp. TCA1]
MGAPESNGAGAAEIRPRRIFKQTPRPPASLAARGGEAYIAGMDQQTVTLSPSAASRVAAIAEKQGKPAILRLSVEGGGCSGFQYKFGLAEAPEADDTVAETDGVRLVVDSVSLDLVSGCVVDYVESLGGAAFRVENPQAAAGCGCGSSFSV